MIFTFFSTIKMIFTDKKNYRQSRGERGGCISCVSECVNKPITQYRPSKLIGLE